MKAAASEVLDTQGPTAHEAVIATDLQGTIRFWNDDARAIYGWSREEVLGRSIMEITVPAASREQGEQIMASLRQGRHWTGSFKVHRKDGTVFDALVTNTPILDPEGELIGIIGVSSVHDAQPTRR